MTAKLALLFTGGALVLALSTPEVAAQTAPASGADRHAGSLDATTTAKLRPAGDPPTRPVFTRPQSDTTIVLAGDPVSSFLVEWSESTDADGDEVDYVYEASLDAAFTQVFLYDDILGSENATYFASEIGILANRLRDAGVALEDYPVVTHHRVTATDGTETATSDTLEITFERGAITDVEDAVELPGSFALRGNYPNPFNPETTVRYDVPAPSTVRLEVFDAAGRRVAVLTDAVHAAGRHERTWRPADAASGLYFVRLTATPRDGGAPFTRVHAMVLLK